MIFETITLKNFYSIGNVTQTVNLNREKLTLILGINNDMGGQDYRNSCGKTSIIQAIFYALYGEPITKIKIDNLINKDNQKEMLVSLTFKVNKDTYRIERGRKPNIFCLYKNDKNINEAHGESKDTQKEINNLIKMSPKLCKQTRILTTKNTPFLSMTDKEQREIIEELFGINILSEKANKLKEEMKETKDNIKSEETRILTVKQLNEKIKQQIKEIQYKCKEWDKKHQKEIEDITLEISDLKQINVEEEIQNHKKLEIYNNLTKIKKENQTIINQNKKILETNERKLSKFKSNNEKIKENICPMCEQSLHEHKIENFDADIKNIEKENKDILDIIEQKEKENSEIILGNKPETLYSNIEEAYEHKNTIQLIEKELDNIKKQNNPYYEQIENLQTSGLQEIDTTYLEELNLIKEHQDFLYKMLTNKESPIRKKIIDQNLSILNNSLKKYLGLIKLPHKVVFNNDLSVTINNYGNEFDFDQLSNGEQNRIILSLAWSFQDVFEYLHGKTNLNIIDELVDSGMDSSGTNACIKILRDFVREEKTVLLISHKDGLETKADEVLYVIKEDGFTNYSENIL